MKKEILCTIVLSAVFFALCCNSFAGNSGPLEIRWERWFGSSKNICSGVSLQQTTDGGYMIGGSITKYGGAFGVYVLKTDQNGNELWHKTFGDKRKDDVPKCVRQTTDGGYIVAGGSRSTGGILYIDVYLLKKDEEGNVVWQQRYGGNKRATSVQETSEGGYVVLGKTDSAINTDSVIYLAKLVPSVTGSSGSDQ